MNSVRSYLAKGKIPEFKESTPPTKVYPIIQVPSSGKRGWMGGARSLFFIYSRDKGNFILEGYNKEVEDFLKKNFTHYFYRYTYWFCGEHRGGWKFWRESIGIFEPSKARKEWKFIIRPYSTVYGKQVSEQQMKELTFHFKRLPKRWIPEFNKL
jgi:hypothetical protein